MKKFKSTEEAVAFFRAKGFRITATPANVAEECKIKYGIRPKYMVNSETGEDIFIVEGEPIAALHRFANGSVGIDLP